MNAPAYEALDGNGRPNVRAARSIGELPHEERTTALAFATAEISPRIGIEAARRIGFGTPAFTAFNMNRHEAKAHSAAGLLLTHGSELSLDLCVGLFADPKTALSQGGD